MAQSEILMVHTISHEYNSPQGFLVQDDWLAMEFAE